MWERIWEYINVRYVENQEEKNKDITNSWKDQKLCKKRNIIIINHKAYVLKC